MKKSQGRQPSVTTLKARKMIERGCSTEEIYKALPTVRPSALSEHRRKLHLPRLKAGRKKTQLATLLHRIIVKLLEFIPQSEIAKLVETSSEHISHLANPDKYNARTAIREALRNGKIKRPVVCQQCERPSKPEAHHEDYSKPLCVDWLCKKCHASRHKKKS